MPFYVGLFTDCLKAVNDIGHFLMFRFLIYFALIIVVAGVSLLGIGWMSLESRPSVAIKSTQYLNDADKLEILLEQLNSSCDQSHMTSLLTVTEVQLESLQGLLQRASEKLAGDATIRQSGTVISLTYRMEYQNILRYLNAHIWITQGKGLPIQKLKVGRLTVSGDTATFILSALLNYSTSSVLGDLLFNSVEEVTMQSGMAKIKLKPLAPVMEELQHASLKPLTSRAKLREQYTAELLQVLDQYHAKSNDEVKSLNDYMRVAFKAVEKHVEVAGPVLTNEAAILSLAIFIGDRRIGKFVGAFDNRFLPLNLTRTATLAGSSDFAQHFLVSAALEILSWQGLALAVGEYKELFDRAQGHSGFSFADLASDRAGVRFANEATNPAKAWLVQQRVVAGITERAYFPEVGKLESGFNKALFVSRFKRVDSLDYKKQLKVIKGKINRLYLYSI